VCGESSCVGSGWGEAVDWGSACQEEGRRGLAATAAGHYREYAMREKIFRKLIWHDGMMLKREVQRYGLTEGGIYRHNYAAGCSFTSLKGRLTLALRCDDTSEINIAQLKIW
jgi:hypothetical protein